MPSARSIVRWRRRDALWRARRRTDEGGVVPAELVLDILQLAFADCLTEHREDGANRVRALFGTKRNDAGNPSYEFARWKALRLPCVAQTNTDRLRQLRRKVVRLAGIDARAEVEKCRPHDAFRDLLVDAAELGDALHERR
jgi:hypothetical protein